MKKLLMLAAVASFSVAANLDAVATRAQAALDPNHPVTKADAAARKAGRKGARPDEVVAVAKKQADAEKSFFGRSKAWACDNKGKIAAGAAVTVVAAAIVDGIARKDKSLVMRAFRWIKGTKAEKQVLAEVNAQLAAQAAN